MPNEVRHWPSDLVTQLEVQGWSLMPAKEAVALLLPEVKVYGLQTEIINVLGNQIYPILL